MTRLASCARVVGITFLASLGVSEPCAAEIDPDPLVADQLPAEPGAHWVWVNDVIFHHMADGKAFLLDGDSGRMLGMLSTGFGFNGVVLGKSGSEILSPETYFSRGTRGERTDVITYYAPRTLSPVAEVTIPPKRASTIPQLANARLTDDFKFLVLYNYTPAQSVSVVDVPARKFVGEIETPGCALVYPTGTRAFFSLCGDGAALQVRLDDNGREVSKSRTAKLFDPMTDPVTEKGVRDRNDWLFATFAGNVVRLAPGGSGLQATNWSLLDEADRKASWRPGGIQHLALHAATRRLFSLMHVGGADTHKDPGTEVWVYDIAGKKRTQRIVLKDMATSIAVTQDAKPLLFAVFVLGTQKVDVYDALSGQFLRSIGEIGLTPMTLVTY